MSLSDPAIPIIEVSDAIPPDTIFFVSPRSFHIVVTPDKDRFKVWDESEKSWLKRCAVMTRIKCP